MSFNIEDPLAGILSDGSDDSFFDDDILGKKPTKKKATPIVERKTALFDLDDDKGKVKPEEKIDDLFNLGGSDKVPPFEDKTVRADVKSTASFKRSLSKESIKFSEPRGPTSSLDKLDFTKSPGKSKVASSTDRLDILGELSIEPRKEATKPLEKRKSTQSLLDDILGSSTKPAAGSGNQVKRPVTAAKSQEFDLDALLGKSEPKQTLPTKANTPKQNTKVETTKEDSGTKKKTSEDWLGIFDDKDNVEEDDSGMPAWLVGDSKKKKPAEPKKEVSKPKEEIKESAENETKEPEKSFHREKQPEIGINFEEMVKLPPVSAIHGSSEDITAEGAALYMQQQESQLMIALQLKAQEEKLATMQMRQKESARVQREAMLASRAQLDGLLRRQADQRRQMQEVIANHQDRITHRIKALLGASNIDVEDSHEAMGETEGNYDSSHTDIRESPYGKEKKQLLQLVQSLQENHDKEIDLMDMSFRRQLAFLEVSLSQSEERMKEESDKLVKFYTEKIGWLEEHHNLYKKMAEDNLSSLTERHRAESDMLRQQHLENVRVLQEHHTALMENIKNAVKQEQVMIQDTAGFSSSLLEVVADVKESKSQCQTLLQKVQVLTENTQHDTEKNMHVRETHISDMMQQLKKERENFDNEKVETREMVKMLEMRLKQMTTMVEEDTATMKQKKMEFEFEKATFSKQTEFAKNVLKKQDEELKILKEDVNKEYQDKITKIDEEKAKAIKDSAFIAKEKASILNLKQELEKTKAELHAQMEEIMEERSKLNSDKQHMHMEEQRNLAKSRDLEMLAKTAIEKQAQADKKYSEAEFIQRKYEDRIRRMQEHVVSLNNREKQIAREKVALSRERLTLHNERKQVESRQCSLCKPTQNIPYTSTYEQSYALPDTFLNAPVSRDYDNGNVSTAMNAIEQEMAHLMGRNFNLRHSVGIVSANREYVDDRTGSHVQSTQATQVESGTFKDYMDPKFMMLRLDVQQVLSNIDTKTEDMDRVPQDHEDI